MNESTLWNLPLRDFLSATASGSPTPGGGSVACVSASLGLGLVIMALEVSAKRKDVTQPAEIAALIAASRERLTVLSESADADVRAFDAYMAALSLPKETDEQKQSRRAALQSATVAATQSPLQAARHIIAALQLAEKAVPLSHKHVVSDVGAGAALLGGALQAVLLNVDINLPSLNDAAFKADCAAARAALAEDGGRLAAEVLNAVQKLLV